MCHKAPWLYVFRSGSDCRLWCYWKWIYTDEECLFYIGENLVTSVEESMQVVEIGIISSQWKKVCILSQNQFSTN